MATLLFALPITSGQTDAARAFAQECAGPRLADFDTSERRIAIPIENWYLQRIGGSDYFTIQVEGSDLNASFGSFIASRDPFDLWFKSRLAEITGVDLNAGPPTNETFAETLLEYKVTATVRA